MLARLHRPNKFVSTICDEIDDLALTLDREEVTAELYEGKFHEHDGKCGRGCDAQYFGVQIGGVETCLQPTPKCSKNVSHEGHAWQNVSMCTKRRKNEGQTGNVEIWAVDILAQGLPSLGLPIEL